VLLTAGQAVHRPATELLKTKKPGGQYDINGPENPVEFLPSAKSMPGSQFVNGGPL
jgi:hypothetical protein